ncbi:RNA 2'-phosphotransferase [Abditibacterium utsteinense]|nr:RNA 2'-phosphotransferase [Abditibacterium utsteinense]
MNPEEIKKKSKWLSKHLRHLPELIGLELESGGWVDVEKLLAAAKKFHLSLSRAELEEVVKENDKQRFSLDASGQKIRANQGHSVEVDLELEAQTPPAILYHGTGAQNRDLLLREGLQKMRRHHVHLSRDIETARKVGARHGKPLIFEVDAAQMHADGFSFFVSDNGVWLIDEVPPRYLSVCGDAAR